MNYRYFPVLLFTLVLTACAPPAAAPQPAAPAADQPAVEPVAEEKDFLTWFQYDQDNEDPASDERVGNEYLRKKIPQFNEAFEGKWNWVNQPKAFNQMAAELVAAVQAVLEFTGAGIQKAQTGRQGCQCSLEPYLAVEFVDIGVKHNPWSRLCFGTNGGDRSRTRWRVSNVV